MKLLERKKKVKQNINMLLNQIVATSNYSVFKKKDDGGMYSGIFKILQSLFQGIYSILGNVGVYAGTISLLCGIAYLAWNSRKPQQLAEGKEVLGRRVAIVAVLFGVTSLVSLVAGVAPT